MQGVNSIGATEYWHAPVSPDCVSVKVSAAIFIVALRPVTSAFRDAEYATVPLPLPWAPVVTASHDALLDAVHGHVAAAVTDNVPVPPSFPIDPSPGVMLYVHGTFAPSCRTET